MMRGYLRIVILKLLSRKEMSGYDIMKYIHEKVNVLKPSPGSIYPLLKKMASQGLIKYRVVGRKKIYSLTKKGREINKEILENKKKLYDKIFAKLRITYSENEVLRFLEALNKKIPEVKMLIPEALKLRNTFIRLITNNDLNKKKIQRINNVIKKARKDLELMLKS